MRRPPFPFAMVLTRAEEERDEQQRVYLRQLERWRGQQRTVSRQKDALAQLFSDLGEQRTGALLGAMAQNHLLYLGRERRRLHDLTQRERQLAVEAENARRALLKASLKLRVWECLRDRFWQEFEGQHRRREEAELEDWSRSRLKPTRSRAVV